MKVALYARVSTDDKGQDTENQLRPMREHCARVGWGIVVEETDHASATDLGHRPGWRRVLEAARRREVDVVMVWALDRAFRSVLHGANTLQELQTRGVGLKVLTQDFDTTTPFGKAAYYVTLAWAEMERELIRSRTRAGLDNARANGKTLGRPKGSKDKAKRRRRGYLLRYATPEQRSKYGADGRK